MQFTSLQPTSSSSGTPAVVGNIVVLCEGTSSDGNAYWAYLCMMPSQAEMFYKARKAGALNLEEYGTILEWGQGEAPPTDVSTRMNQQFGLGANVEEALRKLIQQQGGQT